jgi:hypothetical protein
MMKPKRHQQTILWILLAAFNFVTVEASIIGISKPMNSNDRLSRPLTDNIWSVSAPPFPLVTNLGIGYIINPVVMFTPPPTEPDLQDATLHDHVYTSPHFPDDTRSVITYQFDTPTIVAQLEVIEHLHGITQVEGFIGDSLTSLTSIGSVFGPSGDFTTSSGRQVFMEAEPYVFQFDNARPATFFRFVVRKTNLSNGYAAYRAFPRDPTGQRIPAAIEPPFVVTIQVGEVDVCWPSKTDRTYQVEYRSALTANLWSPLGPPVQGDGSTRCITNSVRGEPQKFYRIQELP